MAVTTRDAHEPTTSRSLAEAIVAGLAAAGTDTVFGVPGGGANLDLVGAAEQAGLRFVLMHGETAAGIAASTHGLVRDRPGAVVVTRGPGAASVVNAAAQATLDRSPLVVVTDTVPRAQAVRAPHQLIDQRAMLAPVTKWSGTLGTGDARALVDAAIGLAMGAPRGAVHLDVDASAPSDPAPAVPAAAGTLTTADDALARARDLIARARRPLIIVGAEAAPWVETLRRVVAATDVPVLTTYQARGLVADTAPQAAGIFTNGAIEREVLDAADLVLAVGLDPVEPIPAPWRPDVPVVALMPWPIVHGYHPIDVELTGAIGPSLEALAGALDASGWEPGAAAGARDRARAALVGDAVDTDRGLAPATLATSVGALVPEGSTITVDAGAHMLVAVPLARVTRPRGLLISNGLATMGFAVPAAIGAAIAEPDRPVVALTGDGGLGMVLAELETIARLDLDVTVVVFDDAALSLIGIKQTAGQGGSEAIAYRDVDFAAVARAAGMDAVTVADIGVLTTELTSMRRGPRLIDVRIDPSSYPAIIRTVRG